MKYHDNIYPGVIQELTETHICDEYNKIYAPDWNQPLFSGQHGMDVLWYLHEDIIRMIPPQTSVTSRHMEIDRGHMVQDLRLVNCLKSKGKLKSKRKHKYEIDYE